MLSKKSYRENRKRWHAWTVIVPVCSFPCFVIPPNSTRAKTQLRIQWLIGNKWIRTGSSSCEVNSEWLLFPIETLWHSVLKFEDTFRTSILFDILFNILFNILFDSLLDILFDIQCFFALAKGHASWNETEIVGFPSRRTSFSLLECSRSSDYSENEQ